jgi:hypothetical protein
MLRATERSVRYLDAFITAEEGRANVVHADYNVGLRRAFTLLRKHAEDDQRKCKCGLNSPLPKCP